MKHLGGKPLHDDKYRRPNMEDIPIANMKCKCGECIVMKTLGECDKKVNTLGCDIKQKRFKKEISDEQSKEFDDKYKSELEAEEKKTIKDLLNEWAASEKDDEDD